MPELKAVFFDNDGVLVDTEGLYYEVTREAMASLGFELSLEDHQFVNMTQGRSSFDLALERGASEEAVASARELRNARYLEALRSSPSLVIPGVERALDALTAPGRLFAIVTSCRRDHFAAIHERSGLLPRFGFVVGQGDYEFHKPHPEPYLKALARAGVKPEEALVVEDAARGVESACAAGLRCVAIPRGVSSSGDFSKAWKRFESLGAFADFQGKLQGFA